MLYYSVVYVLWFCVFFMMFWRLKGFKWQLVTPGLKCPNPGSHLSGEIQIAVLQTSGAKRIHSCRRFFCATWYTISQWHGTLQNPFERSFSSALAPSPWNPTVLSTFHWCQSQIWWSVPPSFRCDLSICSSRLEAIDQDHRSSGCSAQRNCTGGPLKQQKRKTKQLEFCKKKQRKLWRWSWTKLLRHHVLTTLFRAVWQSLRVRGLSVPKSVSSWTDVSNRLNFEYSILFNIIQWCSPNSGIQQTFPESLLNVR